EFAQQATAAGVPDADDPVAPAGGEAPAVSEPGQPEDSATGGQAVESLPGAAVPDPHEPALATAGDPAPVGAERCDGPPAVQGEQPCAGAGGMDRQRRGPPAAEEAFPIGAEADGSDRPVAGERGVVPSEEGVQVAVLPAAEVPPAGVQVPPGRRGVACLPLAQCRAELSGIKQPLGPLQ